MTDTNAIIVKDVETGHASSAVEATVDGIYINHRVYPPVPKQDINVTLTATQYQALVSSAQMEELQLRKDTSFLGLLDSGLTIFLPFLLLIIVLGYSRLQGRSSLKMILDHSSAKSNVEAVHSDVRVILEKQNQILQLLQLQKPSS